MRGSEITMTPKFQVSTQVRVTTRFNIGWERGYEQFRNNQKHALQITTHDQNPTAVEKKKNEVAE
jgi:hypothetical protein